jgi:hypothetical protein
MPSSPLPGQTEGEQPRCRSCGARLAPAATWCSLCHTSVTPAPTPAPIPAPIPAPATVPAQEVAAVDAGSVTPTAAPAPTTAPAPTAAPDVDDLAKARAAVVAQRMIAELAVAESSARSESSLGALHARFSRIAGARSGALLMAVGGGVLLLVTGIIVLTLVGLLL